MPRKEYKNKIKRSNDHYKRAVYSYLCRMNDDDLRVLDNVDDFLWFKLSIALCNSPTSPIDSKLNIRYPLCFYICKNINFHRGIEIICLFLEGISNCKNNQNRRHITQFTHNHHH